MKLFGHFGLCLLALGIGTQVWAQEKTFYIEVENPWEQNKPDYPIVLKTADFKCNFPILSATVYDGEKEIPSQTDDLDRDGKGDEIALLIDMPAKTKKDLRIIVSCIEAAAYRYPSRVYAELNIY